MNQSNLRLLILSLIFWITTSVTLYSQEVETPLDLTDTTQTHLLIFKKGKKIKGRIISIQNDEVIFLQKKKKENSTYSLSTISEIKVLGSTRDWNASTQQENKYAQYLLYTNTAFGIEKGNRNYRTFMGASMLFDYGVNDNFSIGVAYSFPILFSLNMKTTFDIAKNYRSGFKFNYLSIPVLISSDEGFSVLESTMMHTFGSKDKFLNISFSNYWIRKERFFGFNSIFVPSIYNSFSIGGEFNLVDNFHLMIENRVNFNSEFVDAKLLPSIALSYNTQNHHLSVGFLSPNEFGFNSVPILDFNEDDIVVFVPSFISRLPFFTYSKFF